MTNPLKTDKEAIDIVAPWYKQFWLWFILSPLFVVFTVGFSMLYLAIVTNDGVVVDNFYKDGKAIIVRHEEDTQARALGLAAILTWHENELQIQLRGDLQPLPEKLQLNIIFPTSKAGDVLVTLEHQGLGQYLSLFESDVTGLRQLQLQPIDSDLSWRLHAKENVPPISSRIELLPK